MKKKIVQILLNFNFSLSSDFHFSFGGYKMQNKSCAHLFVLLEPFISFILFNYLFFRFLCGIFVNKATNERKSKEKIYVKLDGVATVTENTQIFFSFWSQLNNISFVLGRMGRKKQTKYSKRMWERADSKGNNKKLTE